eukprot:7125883-Prymnesium_polylepis.1
MVTSDSRTSTPTRSCVSAQRGVAEHLSASLTGRDTVVSSQSGAVSARRAAAAAMWVSNSA